MQTLAVGLAIANREIAEEAGACLREMSARVVFEEKQVSEHGTFQTLLESSRPDAILADIPGLGENWEEAVRAIRRCAGCPPVILLHSAADPQTIIRAMRVGVREYLSPPLAGGLKEALERFAAERAEQTAVNTARGKTVAFFSAKGGCGATTLACHTAADIGRHGKDVLLVDFDLGTGIIGFLLRSKSSYSVFDALTNINRMDLSYWKALVSNGLPGLEVITAPGGIQSRPAVDPARLRQLLKFTRSHYDCIVADLGRGLDVNSVSALEEVDQAFLVTTVDVPALHQAKQMIRLLRDSGYKSDRLGLLLNRVPRRTEVTTAEIEKLLGMSVTSILSDDGEALYDCYAEGKLLPPESRLSRQLGALAARIVGAPEAPKKRRLSIFG